jgi:hypothetical protein
MKNPRFRGVKDEIKRVLPLKITEGLRRGPPVRLIDPMFSEKLLF